MMVTCSPPVVCFRNSSLRLAGLLIVLPALLAAGLMEKSGRDSALPEAESYRAPLSESIFQSNSWRVPEQEEPDWRLPPPPPAGWRTPNASTTESSASTRSRDIFPRYQPGRSDYDLLEREDKPLIKLFEFGSK